MSDNYDDENGDFAKAPDPKKKRSTGKKHNVIVRHHNGEKYTIVDGITIKKERDRRNSKWRKTSENKALQEKAISEGEKHVKEHTQNTLNSAPISEDKVRAVAEKISDVRVPDEVITARNEEQKKQAFAETNPYAGKIDENVRIDDCKTPYLCLFYSFDIVDSTAYKSVTIWWPIIIKELIEVIRKRVTKEQDLLNSQMWRVIGDEVIFVLPIQNTAMLASSIDSIFVILQELVRSIKNGSFIDNLDDQRIRSDAELLKYQTAMLSLKCAAWIAAISDTNEGKYGFYNNISFDYPGTSQGPEMHEYLGRDIDAGFRVKQNTMDRRLALSFELAYLLKDERKGNLYIIDYVRMKGVWGNSLYPVIWYYSEETIRDLFTEDNNGENLSEVRTGLKSKKNSKWYSFSNSFRFDETENNELVRNYFKRGRLLQKINREKGKSEYQRTQVEKEGVLLPGGMFAVESACEKLVRDRNLNQKMEYMRTLFTDKVLKAKTVRAPLQLHLAVVCYDPESHKVMIAHRSEHHSLNPRKWDFGCAKALSAEKIVDSVRRYYKHTFNVEVELVLDQNRVEKQPIPLALYEIEKQGHVKKGVILMAVVKEKGEFHKTETYEEIMWVNVDESRQIKEDEAVIDFHHTIEQVFLHVQMLQDV